MEIINILTALAKGWRGNSVMIRRCRGQEP